MHAQQLWAKFLECGECEQGFDSLKRCPLLLLCGHTLCKECCARLLREKGKVECPFEGNVDIRQFGDISPSHHYLLSLSRVEVGCYWHFHVPAVWYCPENLVSACNVCKTEKSDWDWQLLRNVDLPGLLTMGIHGLMSDKDFKEYVYSWNPELKDRYRVLSSATARERQTLYFNLLSYRDHTDNLVPIQVIDPPSNYCTVLENGLIEVSRFRRILPSRYTQDFSKVQTWKVDVMEDQADSLTFSVSKGVYFMGVGLGKECKVEFGNKLLCVTLLQGEMSLDTNAPENRRKFPYTSPDPCIETIMLPEEPFLQPHSLYTLRVKYDGRGVYYGDPTTRCEPIRGPDGFVISFHDTVYGSSDYRNGDGRKSGPILKLYFSARNEGERGGRQGAIEGRKR